MRERETTLAATKAAEKGGGKAARQEILPGYGKNNGGIGKQPPSVHNGKAMSTAPTHDITQLHIPPSRYRWKRRFFLFPLSCFRPFFCPSFVSFRFLPFLPCCTAWGVCVADTGEIVWRRRRQSSSAPSPRRLIGCPPAGGIPTMPVDNECGSMAGGSIARLCSGWHVGLQLLSLGSAVVFACCC